MNALTSPTQFVKAGLMSFAYRKIGTGFPLVLFQRFRGTMDEWDPALIDYLAKENCVIIFDNVGIGATEGQTPDTIKEIAKYAFDFTQALKLSKFNILGWSLGGIVAQVFALEYPKMVNAIILVGTGPGRSTETVYPSERFLETARHDINTPEDHQLLFFTETEEGYNHMLQSLARIHSRKASQSPLTTKENWMAQALAMRDFFGGPVDYFSRLNEIKHPVLVGGAKQDLAFPLVDSYLLAREIPNSQLIAYSNAGHGFHHQYHQHFGNAVNEFLK
jgi:pimeloyl-ACP methyl ester carboxylesterase